MISNNILMFHGGSQCKDSKLIASNTGYDVGFTKDRFENICGLNKRFITLLMAQVIIYP